LNTAFLFGEVLMGIISSSKIVETDPQRNVQTQRGASYVIF
jgi:hypothetical protein